MQKEEREHIDAIKRELAKYQGSQWMNELVKLFEDRVKVGIHKGFYANDIEDLRYWHGRVDEALVVLNIFLPEPTTIKKEIKHG